MSQDTAILMSIIRIKFADSILALVSIMINTIFKQLMFSIDVKFSFSHLNLKKECQRTFFKN
ncbi:hypothetical protein RhiirC2_759685 [Rhizophagus irregularis]|uniref:Uncharacterized protein n=1 Tax=Rhizophagus irregularis TaxID=588596 RepID=A0A2N1ML19_9GLOM|nr:hypothetical protein RhiirC2_759685 [Rhizophagus irregularis]